MQFWLLLIWFHKSPKRSIDQSPAPTGNKPCASLAVSQLFSHQIPVKFFNHFFGTSLTHGLHDWLSYRFVSFSVCLNTLKIRIFLPQTNIYYTSTNAASLKLHKGAAERLCPALVFIEKLWEDDQLMTSFVVKRRPNDDFWRFQWFSVSYFAWF